jgi:N-acetylneuraminic acid mutarotase
MNYKRITFIALFLILLSRGAWALGEPLFRWEASSGMPDGRSNPAVLAYQGALYVAGGNDAQGGTDSFWRFDPLTGTWTTLPTMPHKRWGHCAVIWNGKLLVMGGLEKEGTRERPVKSIDAYDFKVGHWYEHAVMPSWRTRFALVPLGDKVMITGGNDEEGNATRDVQIYNPASPVWKQGAPLPELRSRHQAVYAGGQIMVLGGENGMGTVTNSNLIFLKGKEHWVIGKPMLRARKNFFCARLGTRVYVGGGWEERGKERVFIDECESYNCETRQWSTLPSLGEGCDGIRAASLEGKIYLFGGFGGSFRNDLITGFWKAPRDGWQIDDRLKFHLAFFDHRDTAGKRAPSSKKGSTVSKVDARSDHDTPGAPAATPAGTREHTRVIPPGAAAPPAETIPSLGLSADFMPDISNITLKGVCDLGFPLPRKKKADLLAFYLKFYHYPATCNAFLSAAKVALPLQLFSLSEGGALQEYLKKPGHVLVKKGFIGPIGRAFTAQSPFPPFALSRRGAMSGQEYLDNHIPFASLYVTAGPYGLPVSVNKGDDAREARGSAAGVLKIHEELRHLYHATFREMKDLSKTEPFTFIDDSQKDYVIGEPQQVRCLRLPRAPMVFETFRNLPMPQDPRMYLTGLLLIHHDTFTLQGEIREALVCSKMAPGFSQVFEIGSVIVVKEPESP